MTWVLNLTTPLPWYADPVWGFVSSIAQVLSLIAIGGAIVGWTRNRRKLAPVIWGLDLLDTAEVEGERYHLAELYNAGTGAAYVQSVHLIGFVTIKQTADHRLKTVMGPGDRATFPFSTEAVEDAWILISWVSHDDSSKLQLKWLPVARPGAMHDAFSISREVSALRWWQIQRRRVRPVGPGYLTSSSVKLREKSRVDKFHRDFAIAYRAITSAITVIAWGIDGSARIEDIPLPNTYEARASIALAAQIRAEREA